MADNTGTDTKTNTTSNPDAYDSDTDELKGNEIERQYALKRIQKDQLVIVIAVIPVNKKQDCNVLLCCD